MRGAARKRMPGSKVERPDVFGYLDYRAFFKDWLAYQKASQSGVSLRALARNSGLTAGYLSMAIAGTRPLTEKALAKLKGSLNLNDAEFNYLHQLVILGTSQQHEERFSAVEKMKRYRSYRRLNPKETEVYQYLSQWYYVAIREMTGLPDFRADAQWIQARLRSHVELKEIKEALRFLSENGFIQLLSDGRAIPPEKRLDCDGGVFRLSMSNFHKQVLKLAGESIENTDREHRQLQGHAFVADAETFEKAKTILEEAFERIRSLTAESPNSDSVYYLEMALFPFTQKPNGSEQE